MAEATILKPEMVLPSTNPAGLRRGAAIAVAADRVAALGALDTLRARWPNADEIELADCLVMPGLVNAHQHGRGLSQILFGLPDDYLERWINRRRGRGPLDPYPITKLAAAHMVANGVTATIHANYSYGSGDYEAEVRASLRAYDDVGIRATMCVGAMDQGTVVYPPHEACFMAGLPRPIKDWLARPRPPAYAGDGQATVELMARLLHDFEGHPRLRLCYGPAAPQWVSDGLWRALARDADKRGLGMHLHALESPAQARVSAELYPEGVFAHLRKLGALNERTVIAHGVYVDDRDIETIARAKATVVRNPGSNLRLRNGIAPLTRFLEGGVRVAIGTDNMAVADDEDLLGELRLAQLLAAAPDWNGPPPPSPRQLLAMATANGCVAAQLGSDVGTLAPGKKADLIAVSLERIRRPYLDADTGVVEAMLARGHGGDVALTMIDGRIVYRDGRLNGLDIAEIEREAGEAALAGRLSKDAAAVGLARRLGEAMTRHYRAITRAKARTRAARPRRRK